MKQLESPGIDIRKLKPGTRLVVHTENSVYFLDIVDYSGNCLAYGGLHLPEPLSVQYVGATYRRGGPCKLGWIGLSLCMEFALSPKRNLTTSAVTSAKLIGDDWEYEIN